MTPAEKRLWWHLDRVPVPGTHFRRQAPVGPYVVDFVCHTAKLVIEVDGAQHGFDQNAAADLTRTRWLEAQGYRVLRFWNGEVLHQIDVVLDTIHAALYSPSFGGRAGTPTPVALRATRPSRLAARAASREGNSVSSCPISSSNCSPKKSPPACSAVRRRI